MSMTSTEEAVYEMLDAGELFADVEDFIDELDADGEEKTTLWLLAWSEQPLVARRAILSS